MEWVPTSTVPMEQRERECLEVLLAVGQVLMLWVARSCDPSAAAPGHGEPSQLMHKRQVSLHGPQKDICCLTLKVAKAKASQAMRDSWSGVNSQLVNETGMFRQMWLHSFSFKFLNWEESRSLFLLLLLWKSNPEVSTSKEFVTLSSRKQDPYDMSFLSQNNPVNKPRVLTSVHIKGRI